MTASNPTPAVTMFCLRYRDSDSAPDAWRYIDVNGYRPSDIDPCITWYHDSLPGANLTTCARTVAAAANKMKEDYRGRMIFAVHRHTVTDPDFIAMIEAATKWKEREAARFEDGTYTRTIFEGMDWFEALQAQNLFIHNSAGKPGCISLTASEQDGARDRQTRLSVSRFLSRYYPGTGRDGEERRQALLTKWNEHHNLLPDLKFTKDADTIYHVYRNGPGACMSYERSHFDTRCEATGEKLHPTLVYADSPDLELAYLTGQDEDGDPDRIVARALVWPERKIYGRPYGDTYALEALLQAKGWRRCELVGARIRAIPLRGGDWLMPYIDDTCAAQTDCHQYHRIAHDGEGDLYAGNTCGRSDEAHQTECEHCGDVCHPDETYRVESRYGSETWCDGCAHHETVTDGYGNRYDSDCHVELDDHTGRVVHEDDYFICDRDGCCYHLDDMHKLSDGSTVYSGNADDYQAQLDAEAAA